MAKSSEIIVMEMLEFIQLEGGNPRTWYIGVTDDAHGRLFDEHQVHYQDDAWIYRTATSEIEAQRVEEYFLGYGWTEERHIGVQTPEWSMLIERVLIQSREGHVKSGLKSIL